MIIPMKPEKEEVVVSSPAGCSTTMQTNDQDVEAQSSPSNCSSGIGGNQKSANTVLDDAKTIIQLCVPILIARLIWVDVCINGSFLLLI